MTYIHVDSRVKGLETSVRGRNASYEFKSYFNIFYGQSGIFRAIYWVNDVGFQYTKPPIITLLLSA